MVPQAVIDIGSTGLRLLVAEFSPDGKQNVLDRSDSPISLGKDVFTDGYISQEVQNQLIQILCRYKEQLASWGISSENTSCFASSAFRDAKNSDPIMDRILVQTGFRVKIIDGLEEIKMMYIAVSECLKEQTSIIKSDDTVILVVGGSTTEIMMMSQGKMVGVHSLRIGTVRITQQIRNKASSYDDILRYMQESINNTRGTLESELKLSKVNQFVAVGPDVTLAALMKGESISTFLWEIQKEDFLDFVKEVQKYSVDECVAKFKIPYNEAETLLVSLLIYKLFFTFTKAEKMIVPETSVRSGVLISKNYGENESLQEEFNMQIIASAKNLLRKFHGDEKHAECVKMIAERIYDVLKDEISLDEHSKLLLEISAILHDIGTFIRYDNHNLHSSYIIRNSEIFGLSKKDITIVSEIAKYHKGYSVPQDEESFLMLPRNDRMTILKLTSILRIADALDRGHIQKFSDFTLRLDNNSLIIHTINASNTVLEKIALSEKSGMFESVFGYKVILI